MAGRTVSPVFVGRHAELDRLTRAVERAHAGSSSTILVAGEAGVGKTRLLQEWLESAGRSGARILLGGCISLGDGEIPYAPFSEAFRGLAADLGPDRLAALAGPHAGALARLVPTLDADHAPGSPLGDWSDPDARARLFELVLGLLAGLSADGPVVLALEDLHWADPSSRGLLAFLARNLHEGRVLIVGTYRSDELRRRHPLLPLLGVLERLPSVERIDLARLDRAELAELLAAVTGELPGTRVVDDMLRRSDGNPFFVEQLLVADRAPSDSGLPPTLQNILVSRLAALSDPAQHLLRVAAVIGRRAEHELLAALAGLPGDELVAVLRETVEQQLLLPVRTDDGPAYDFRHALVREVAYDDLLPSERVTLHRAVAEALERVRSLRRAPADLDPRAAAELAYHWSGAQDEPRALAASVRAGRAAARVFAHDEALEQFERALRRWDRVPAATELTGIDHRALLEEAAAAAAGAGSVRRAVELASELVAPDRDNIPPVPDEDWARRIDRLGWYESELGDQPRSLATVESALGRLPAEPPTIGRVRLLTTRGVLLWALGNYGDGVAKGPATVEIARRLGDRRILANALLVLGASRASYGQLSAAVTDLTEARTLFIEAADPMSGIATSQLGYALLLGGRFDDAIAVCNDELERQARLGGSRRFGPYLKSDIADCWIELGRWDEVIALCEATLSDLEESRTAPWFHETLALVLVPRGQLDAAERALQAANQAVGRDADVIDRIWILRPTIALARARRRIDAVRTAVEQALAISGDPTHDAPLWDVLDIALGAEADAAEAAAARRDDAGLAAARAAGHRLADLAEEAADAAAETEPLPPTLRAIRLRVTAERARLDGRPDPRAWSRAAAAFDAVPNPFKAAVSRLREAEAILVSDAPRGQATEPLRAAFDVATRLRAEPLRDELLALGRRARIDLDELAAGDRPEVRAPADHANAHGLTAREREVLGLLARGLSNREIGETLFISEKTASVHVSNLLGKLGVSGRGAAAAIAVRLELDDPEGRVGGS